MKLFKGREGVGIFAVIVLIIIIGGFFAFHHKSHKPAVITIGTYVDPTKTYSFNLPSNWKIGTAPVTKAPPVGSDLSVETDIENTSVHIPGAPIIYGTITNFIELQLNQTSDMKDLFCENITTTLCSPENLTINGNPALFQRVVDSSTYETTDYFAINHGSKTVDGFFIESRSTSYTPTIPGTNKLSNVRLPAFNESGSYGAFRTLVHSIKFLNN